MCLAKINGWSGLVKINERIEKMRQPTWPSESPRAHGRDFPRSYYDTSLRLNASPSLHNRTTLGLAPSGDPNPGVLGNPEWPHPGVPLAALYGPERPHTCPHSCSHPRVTLTWGISMPAPLHDLTRGCPTCHTLEWPSLGGAIGAPSCPCLGFMCHHPHET